MQFSATQIALIISGKVEGNPDITVSSFGKIEEARANQLAFLANPKYEDFLYTTQASIVIVNESLELKQPITTTLIRVPDAYSAFATLLDKYNIKFVDILKLDIETSEKYLFTTNYEAWLPKVKTIII